MWHVNFRSGLATFRTAIHLLLTDLLTYPIFTASMFDAFCYNLNNDSVTGCSLWTRKANRAAENGVFYGFLSEADCTAVCLTSANCVAVDLGPYGCVLHNNVDDLTTAFIAPGVTQFVLNRHCLPTTPAPTTITATVSADNYTTSIGISLCFKYFQIVARALSKKLYFHSSKCMFSTRRLAMHDCTSMLCC